MTQSKPVATSGGAKLTASAFTLGVDVSSYQPTIDWPTTRAGGWPFAFIKATEALAVDPDFATHFPAAKAAGILRGAYHFFHPEVDATAQANFFLAQLATDPGELPPMLDVEQLNKVPAAQAAAAVAVWVNVVTTNFARPVIYTSPGFWNALPAIAGIGGMADLWVAQWTSASPEKVDGWDGWTFWQYSDTGSVPGIPVAVDVDRFDGSVAELTQYSQSFVASLNGGAPTFNLYATIGVQQALNYLQVTNPPLQTDGVLGPLTTAAIKQFQTAAGIAVDGVVGPQTRVAIRSAIANGPAPAVGAVA